MLNFLGKSFTSLNLEITNRCILQCSGCARTGNHEILRDLKDLPVEILDNLFDRDTLASLPSGFQVNLCGVYGDCIYHRDFHTFLRKLKEFKVKINMETNGSFKDKGWWEETISILDTQDTVTFSVDGLKDTNHIYRKNSRWEDIEIAIKTCAKKVIVEWKFIVFSHNEHQVSEAKDLAKAWNVRYFTIVKSSRFGLNDPLEPSSQWEALEKKSRQSLENFILAKKSPDQDFKILPKCMGGKNLGITYEGAVYPCCTFSTETSPFMEKFRKKLNLKENTLTTILNFEEWGMLQKSWDKVSTAPSICQKYCGVQNEMLTKTVSTHDFYKMNDRQVFDLQEN